MTINYPLVFVSLALFFQISSLIFESLHLWIYSGNGTGLFLFDLLSQLFYIASQFIFTVLLILLSWGWTINFMEFESMTIFMPFSILIGIIQIGFVFLSKASDDTYYKFHDYEDLAGYLIVFVRSGLFFYFLKGLYRTFMEANEKIRSFIVKLGIFGSIYILAFPVIIFINTIVAAYCRHQVIVIGSLVLQIFGILIITILFNKKKGNYYDISLQSTPLLPMGKKKKGKID